MDALFRLRKGIAAGQEIGKTRKASIIAAESQPAEIMPFKENRWTALLIERPLRGFNGGNGLDLPDLASKIVGCADEIIFSRLRLAGEACKNDSAEGAC